MTGPEVSRRHLLGLAGGMTIAGLAGCLGDGDGPSTNSGQGGDDDSEGAGDADDDHDHDSDADLGHPAERVEVTMESDEDGHHFVPHVGHVEPGGTVTWALERGVHDTVAYHPANADILPSVSERRIPDDVDPWASDVYDTPGETFELVFEVEGVYDYTCTISGHGHRGGPHGPHPTHESTGMVGRVIVGDPDLDTDVQPAMRAPADELPDAARTELEGFNERTRSALEAESEH